MTGRWDGLGDDVLAQAAAAGDRHAFTALLNRHYDAMFRMAWRWCGSHDTAEDITQEACMKLAKHIGGYEGRSTFRTWLMRIVITSAQDWWRGHGGRRKQETALSDDDGILPEALHEQASQTGHVAARELLAQVHGLPDGQRDAVLLVCGEGLSHREAAAIMDCAESTVSWHIHKARQSLAHWLTGEAEGRAS